jgi:predicted DNA binding CopG/RHH family protein
MADEKQKRSKTAYKNQFIAENYDRVNLTVPKGDKERIKNHAEKCGETLNGFIQRAIHETMERDGGNA